MILLLLITRSRPKVKKNQLARRLKRKLQLAKGRLVLIEDKAWEPERCVAVADFKSMVRTAKKLKYPIFLLCRPNVRIAGGVLLPFVWREQLLLFL
jgi:hypothetical protein